MRTDRALFSITMNPASSTAARPNDTTAGAEPQPRLALSVSPSTSASTAPVPAAAASTGTRPLPPPSRAGLKYLTAARAQARVSGTLTKNVSRHDAVVSSPPSMAPTASPAAPTAAHTASARFLAGPAGKTVPIRPRIAGCSSAAARPWVPRAASSTAPSCATPPTALATQNRLTATRKRRLAPSRSASRPPTIRKPANPTA